jgi:hypothetical protein
MKIIRDLDFLSFQPQLLVKGESRFKNAFGGVISILLILFCLTSIIYFGLELIYKKTPIIVETASNFNQVGPYNFSYSDFGFYFSLKYRNLSLTVDKSIFSIKAEEILLKEDFVQYRQLNIDLCYNFYDKDKIEESNINLDFDELFCIEPNTTSVYGFPGEDASTMVKITVEKCSNSSLNNYSCSPIEVINENLQGSLATIYISTYEYFLNNYTHPIKKEFYMNSFLLNAFSGIECNINISPLEINSDIGFILPDSITQIGFKSTLNQVMYNLGADAEIFSFYFSGINKGTIKERTYQKLQDVLTKVGGFLKMLILAGDFIVIYTTSFYYKFEFWKDLRTNIKEINSSQKNLSTLNQILPENTAKQVSHQNLLNVLSNNRIPSVKNSKQSIWNIENLRENTSPVNHSFSFINRKATRVKYDCLNKLFFKLVKVKNFEIVYENIEERFRKMLSVNYIFKQFMITETLTKYVFFDEECDWGNLMLSLFSDKNWKVEEKIKNIKINRIKKNEERKN